jgi:hypothetical protein
MRGKAIGGNRFVDSNPPVLNPVIKLGLDFEE